MKKIKNNIGLILMFLIGLSILIYPTVSNKWNQYRANILMSEYSEGVKELGKEACETYIKEAMQYNSTLLGGSVPDAFSIREGIHNDTYESILNISGNGIIGEIEIPKIGVNLPIYHYTFDEVLEKGAGHLFGSTLPVGGENTHAVITAHRGLPSAKMFTDLNLMEEGDCFYIRVLNKTLAYEIDSIETVEPTQTESLAIQDGKDMVTLITCTPYAVNSHRLLVHGHRITMEKAKETTASTNKLARIGSVFMGMLCVLFGILLACGMFLLVRYFTNKVN